MPRRPRESHNDMTYNPSDQFYGTRKAYPRRSPHWNREAWLNRRGLAHEEAWWRVERGIQGSHYEARRDRMTTFWRDRTPRERKVLDRVTGYNLEVRVVPQRSMHRMVHRRMAHEERDQHQRQGLWKPGRTADEAQARPTEVKGIQHHQDRSTTQWICAELARDETIRPELFRERPYPDTMERTSWDSIELRQHKGQMNLVDAVRAYESMTTQGRHANRQDHLDDHDERIRRLMKRVREVYRALWRRTFQRIIQRRTIRALFPLIVPRRFSRYYATPLIQPLTGRARVLSELTFPEGYAPLRAYGKTMQYRSARYRTKHLLRRALILKHVRRVTRPPLSKWRLARGVRIDPTRATDRALLRMTQTTQRRRPRRHVTDEIA